MWSLAGLMLAMAVALGYAAESASVGGVCAGAVCCLIGAWPAARMRSERVFLPVSVAGLVLLGVAGWLAQQAPPPGPDLARLGVPGLLAALWFGAGVFFRLCAVALSEDEHPGLAIYAPQGSPGCLSALCMLAALWHLGILAQLLFAGP